MKFYLKRNFFGGFIASILILTSLAAGAFIFINEVVELGQRGSRAQHILLLTERIKSLMNEGEKWSALYSFNKNEKELQQYKHSTTELQSLVQDLDLATADDEQQNNFVQNLNKSIRQKFDRQRIDIPPSGAVQDTAADSIQFLISEITQLEADRRLERQSLLTKHFDQFIISFFGLTIVGIAIPLSLAYALNKNLQERTKAEEKLAQASITVEDLYQNAPCGYFSLNSDGIFSHANNTFLSWLGYSKQELVDKLHFRDVFAAGPNAVYDNDFSALKEKESLQDIQSKLNRKNKTILPVSINAIAVWGKDKNFLSSRCTVFDLTELKRAEEETRKVNIELEAFSYSISHDLRAPLRSINGFARILREEYEKKIDGEAFKLVTRISDNAKRMGHLIDDLLNFSKLGKKEIKKSEVDADLFVKALLSELVEQEPNRKISADVQPLGKCLADPSMLQQVWINLISNALKYSRKNELTEIKIGRTEEGNQAIYFIKDNGVGFDMEYSSKLFGVFQRLHKIEDFDGTGVGLALVKKIVERHHGRIWAEAKLNVGATFYFTLPMN